MKKLLLITFVLLSITLFMYKTHTVHAIDSSKNLSELNDEDVLSKDSKEKKDLIAALGIRKTKYAKIRSSLHTNFQANEALRMRLLKNPSFAKLFSKNLMNDRAVFGFFGSKYDMFEMYITEANSEPENGRIAVRGLTRLGSQVTEIKGFYYVDAAGENKSNPGDVNQSQDMYCKGRFELNETQKGKATGTYRGEWFADISRTENDDQELGLAWNEGITNHNGKLELGVWKSALTNKEKELCISANEYEVGREVFDIFEYGGRDVSLKEPYASHGWKKYYDYDEWWATYLAKN